MSTSGPILLLGDRDGELAGQLGNDDIEAIGDVAGCLERTSSLQAEGRPATLVALVPSLPQPFTAARRVREADASVGLAVVVGPSEVQTMEAKLAFVPQLTDVVVVPSEPAAQLGADLRLAARQATERSQLHYALADINARLQGVDQVRDAAARRRASASERYLAALTRHVPEAIVSVDADGRVVSVNEAATTILAIDGAPEGRPIEQVLVVEERDRLEAVMADVARGLVREGVEVTTRRRPDGEVALLALTAAPVQGWADEPAGAVLLAREITQQRRAEEELRALERAEGLATLAGGVAHDFNNLLMTIRGWTTLAAQDVEDVATVRTALGHIDTASERAAELAGAMLSYSGRSGSDRRECDLNALLDGMRSLFAAAVPRQIEVRLHLADAPPIAHADATQIRQVVLNLVTNAAEAIGDEPGRIDLVLRPETDGHVRLEVSDTGHGIDERTAERIFEPFFTTRFTGRGLGLAATRGIVRAHDGDIHVESTPGSGARFLVTLPAADQGPTG